MIVRRIPVADGVALHTLVWDGTDARQTPYLLVHGLSSNCQTWGAVAERLHGQGHTVASVDLRGHGRSDKPDAGYDFGTLTADVLTVIRELGFERPVVAGQSTGGNIAVELAHRAPGALTGVVGVDGGVLDLQSQWPSWDDCRTALTPPQFAGTSVEAFEAVLRKHHPDWPDRGIEATMANCEVLADGTVRPWLSLDHHLAILRALWEQRPLALLPDIDTPVRLVLASSADGWSDSKRAAANAAVSAGRHVEVDWLAGDHDLHVQHPDRVADLILADDA